MNKLTIVIPTYNQASYLSEALEGIRNQKCQEFDLIISDNASTDNTQDVVKSCGIQGVIYKKEVDFLNKTSNWNRAVRYSSTPWTMLHHSDDILAPDAVGYILEAINKNPDAALIHGQCHVINSKGKLTQKPLGFPFPMRHTYQDGIIKFVFPVSIVGFTFKTEDFLDLNGFDEKNYQQLQDWDYCMRLSQKTILLYIPKLLGYWRVGQLNNKLKNIQCFETLALYVKYNLIISWMGKARIIHLIKSAKSFYLGYDQAAYELLIKELKTALGQGCLNQLSPRIQIRFFKLYLFMLKFCCSVKTLLGITKSEKI